ncbi:MAG: tetratricopeptide repeat protein [Vampirovibrionia bacterium]
MNIKTIIQTYTLNLTYLYLGLINLFERKNYDIAEKYFKKVLQIEPENTQALIKLGHINIIKKNYNEARKYLLQVKLIDNTLTDEVNKLLQHFPNL